MDEFECQKGVGLSFRITTMCRKHRKSSNPTYAAFKASTFQFCMWFLKRSFKNFDFAPDAIDICIIGTEIGHNYLAMTHVSHDVLKGELVDVSKYPKWRIRLLLAYTRCHKKSVTMIVMAFQAFFFLFEWNNQNVIICWMGLSNKRRENDSSINWESSSKEIWIQRRR